MTHCEQDIKKGKIFDKHEPCGPERVIFEVEIDGEIFVLEKFYEFRHKTWEN